MNIVFDSHLLEEKLSKLDNSTKSIQTLSEWCIDHREKAREVVELWKKLFCSSPKEQKIPFLYLANDILQNSRRKGSEFVNEFWKVLPGVLKNVYENGDDQGKKVIMRLVHIWDERKVFGSRGRDLVHSVGNGPLLENSEKSSHTVKIIKKDAQSIRVKLAIGGITEKIVTSYKSLLDEHFTEDVALNKCKSAVSHLGTMVKDIDDVFAQGSPKWAHLLNELQEQESILRQHIQQLENAETSRAALILQLKEALQAQESKAMLIHTQLQVAKEEVERASNLKQRLMLAIIPSPTSSHPITTRSSEATSVTEPALPIQQFSTPSQPSHLLASTTNSATTAEEENKKAAAAVAAKLAAMPSSALMFASVLSSLIAEEAADLNSGSSATSTSVFPMEKRPKLETSRANLQQPPQTSQPSHFALPPPMQQARQASGVMPRVAPFGLIGNAIPSPAPLSAHQLMRLMRPGAPQPAGLPQQQLQQPTTTGFYQSPGIDFYGQPQMTPVLPHR